jgi:hypothetical protein
VLFDPLVILLAPIVEVTIAAMNDLSAQGLADGTWVGIMPVGRHSLWGVTIHSDYLSEEAFGRRHIPSLGSQLVGHEGCKARFPVSNGRVA